MEAAWKNTLELLAFSAKFAFHISADLFIENLIANEQDTVYFTSAGQGGSLVVKDGLYTAPWRSSFEECKPGKSTYIPQVVEAGWAVEDILNGSTKCDTTDKMLANNEDNMEMM